MPRVGRSLSHAAALRIAASAGSAWRVEEIGSREEWAWWLPQSTGGPPPPVSSPTPICSFPVSSSGLSLEQVAEAKQICARCQVQPQCLAFALRTRQAHGVWGGMSEQERYQLWERDERRMIQAR